MDLVELGTENLHLSGEDLPVCIRLIAIGAVGATVQSRIEIKK